MRLIARNNAGTLLSLAWRNVFRHRVRAALTTFVITAGVSGLILVGGFVENALTHLREATIHSQLGHLQIYRTGYFEHGSHSPYKYVIDAPSDALDVVRREPEVAETMSRLSFVGAINNGRTEFAILGEGIEPGPESRLGTSVEFVSGRNLVDGDHYGIVLGEGVATATKLNVGDHATLLINTAEGALNNIEFEVVGIFRSFSKDFDARAVRITLEGAHELLASDGINSIVVLLQDTDQTNAVARRIKAAIDDRGYEVKTWRELADFYDKTATLYARQFGVLEVIILIAVILSVVNSVNMSIFERTGEFGTLMAVGTRGRAIFRLVLIENMLLGAIGSTVGLIIGIVGAVVLTRVGIPMPPPPNSSTGYLAGIEWTGSGAAIAWVIGFCATALAAILPARRVANMPVVDALRQN